MGILKIGMNGVCVFKFVVWGIGWGYVFVYFLEMVVFFVVRIIERYSSVCWSIVLVCVVYILYCILMYNI